MTIYGIHGFKQAYLAQAETQKNRNENVLKITPELTALRCSSVIFERVYFF